ncbi:MAG: YnbE family lipoprotein [Methylomonas sp.]|nr:YnbE family lipoprotein [Methylomonas sp.]MCK9607682.1 YnbE family lipoprotein [Methylomonas sp.]
MGCSPSVRLEAPEKPIEITMNIKIEHEIRLKVEKDVDALISSNKDLF